VCLIIGYLSLRPSYSLAQMLASRLLGSLVQRVEGNGLAGLVLQQVGG
jgi:hypothetical protein